MNRSTIAAFGLLAVAVLTIFNLLLDTKGMKFPDIAMFDSGVSKVRPSLPKTGVVGFYTDQPGNAGAPQEFYLTQYSIAPVLLENNVDHPLVIASIHTPESRVTNPNLKLVHDFNNGIQLFRNVTK